MAKEKYAIFTMDVEAFSDTECVHNAGEHITTDLLDGFDEYIKILDKHNIKSTLFTVGSLAPKIADKLKSCLKNGHRLALHSYEHVAPIDTDAATFKSEIAHCKKRLGELFNTEISGFRAPFFSLDNNRLNILKELGFKYDSSHLGFLAARHTVDLDFKKFTKLSENIFKSDDFFEFSLSKEKIFGSFYPVSGGGYVRLSNWPFIKGVIKHHIKNNDYYVFYLHPFELTRKKIPTIKNLKAYDKYYLQAGIKSYGKHIEQIILMLKKFGYSFITFEELSQKLSNEN